MKIKLQYKPNLPPSKGQKAIEPIQFGKIKVDQITKGYTITDDFKLREVDCRVICTDYGILKKRNPFNVENHIMQVSFGNGNFKQRWFELDYDFAKTEQAKQLGYLSEALLNECDKMQALYSEVIKNL